MKRILLLLLLLLPVAFLSPLYAQPHYEFRMLDASGGLPENSTVVVKGHAGLKDSIKVNVL